MTHMYSDCVDAFRGINILQTTRLQLSDLWSVDKTVSPQAER